MESAPEMEENRTETLGDSDRETEKPVSCVTRAELQRGTIFLLQNLCIRFLLVFL